MEMRRSAASMGDLRRKPGHKLAPVSSQCVLAPLDVSVACAGVRGLQQVRRSRSTSRLGNGRVQRKVNAANHYISQQEVEAWRNALCKGFNVSPQPEVMLRKAVLPPVPPFKKHYQQNFQGSSLGTKAMEALYSKMAPKAADNGQMARLKAKQTLLEALRKGLLAPGLMALSGAAVCKQADTAQMVRLKAKQTLVEAMRKGLLSPGLKEVSVPTVCEQAKQLVQQVSETVVREQASTDNSQMLRLKAKQTLLQAVRKGLLLPKLKALCQETPVAEVAIEKEDTSFRKYYREHFQGNCLGNGGMVALYQDFAPRAVPIQPATKQADNTQMLRLKVKQTLLKAAREGLLLSALKALPEEHVEAERPPFQQYYKEHFQDNCLSTNVMEGLYASFRPNDHAIEVVAPVIVKSNSFGHMASVGTWHNVFKPKAIQVNQPVPTVEDKCPQNNFGSGQIHFALRPSVASWCMTRPVKPQAQ